MRLLELFSGTGSVGMSWREAGHEVISVDIDGRYNPEIVGDIMQWSYCKSPTPDVIWASVPCEQYSRARTTGRERQGPLRQRTDGLRPTRPRCGPTRRESCAIPR